MSAAEQTAQGGAESLAVIGSRGARPRPLDLSPSAVCPLTQLHPYATCCPPPSVCPPSHVPWPAVGSSSACSAGIPRVRDLTVPSAPEPRARPPPPGSRGRSRWQPKLSIPGSRCRGPCDSVASSTPDAGPDNTLRPEPRVPFSPLPRGRERKVPATLPACLVGPLGQARPGRHRPKAGCRRNHRPNLIHGANELVNAHMGSVSRAKQRHDSKVRVRPRGFYLTYSWQSMKVDNVIILVPA